VTPLGNKTFLPIIKERFKEILKESGKTQKQLAEELDITPEHLTRCLTKGKISKTWLFAIAKYLDISEKYLTGEIDTALTYLAEHRKDFDSLDAIKQFMISRGFHENYCDSLNDSLLMDIEYFISYICEHHESPLGNMADNEINMAKQIRKLDERISELEEKKK
jgi:transcriptional regulator with XRE-family HTH domain